MPTAVAPAETETEATEPEAGATETPEAEATETEATEAEAEATETPEPEIKVAIHPYVKSPKPGRYDKDVKDLIEAGDDAAITLTVPTNQVKRHMTYFQDSAKQNHRTARKTDITDLGNGLSEIEFILRPLVKRPRKVEEDSAGSDAPKSEAA